MSVSFLQTVITEKGVVTSSLADELHITKQELASATGLSRDAVTKTSRSSAVSTQKRLREVVDIVNRIIPWAGSLPSAFAWYRSQPIPSFGDKTAEDLLKEGKGQAVRDYLSRIAEGGYA